MAFQTARLFNLAHLLPFYAFVVCGTVCSYNTHWAFTPKHFQNPITERNGLDTVPIWLHIVLAVAAALGALYFFWVLRVHWIWLAGAGLLSGLYTAPKIPLPVTKWLREIAVGKTIFLTLAWTYITAVLPVLLEQKILMPSQIIFAVNRFFLIYAICIVFDLRDRESDRSEGIRSLVTAWPVKAVDALYFGSLIVYGITSVWLGYYFSAAVVVAFLIPGLILLVGYNWFKKQRSEMVYNVFLDGLMVISLPLLLLFGF